MKSVLRLPLVVFVLLMVASCRPPAHSSVPDAANTGQPDLTQTIVQPAPTAMPSLHLAQAERSPIQPEQLLSLISTDTLLDTVTDLTQIQAYSGWRNSGAHGEREAILYLKDRLKQQDHLNRLGMEVGIQDYNVFLSTEFWATHLYLTVNGREIEVPANGLRGPRDEIDQALRFDSDGGLNDAAPNPVNAKGSALVIRSRELILALTPKEVRGKIVFLDYAVIDRVLQDFPSALSIISELIKKEPAAVILVTRFSNKPDESHGTFIGDASVLNWVTTETTLPVFHVRLEDLQPAEITTWEDLNQIEQARLNWDADVFSPGHSQNLIVRIPGEDSSQAVLLTAHIDSANNPGALDDAVGSAVLLEVAHIFNEAQYRPKTDIYLVWFGGQILGFYGSYNFVAHHQDLLDRTIAVLQLDSLTYPIEGIRPQLHLVTWSYGRFNNPTLTWPNYLTEVIRPLGIETQPENLYELQSDNTAFAAFNVPNAHLIYIDRDNMYAAGGFHYSGHTHDPYDTVELIEQQANVLEQVAQIAIMAVVSTSERQPYLRITPPPRYKALFIGAYTEAIHMTPPAFTDLGMALAVEGYDIDMIPFGQPVTAGDLTDADLVIVLPSVDYPSPDGDVTQYDVTWQKEEIDLLESYVNDGGFLVLTNSAYRLKYGNWTNDLNEDWQDMNDLASRFGVTYHRQVLHGKLAKVLPDVALAHQLVTLTLAENNGVAFRLNDNIYTDAQTLAVVGDLSAATLINHDHGGKVLVLADVGILGADWGEPPHNLPLWQQIARQAARMKDQ